MKCSYGCGKDGKYKLTNGKYYCEKTYQKCPAVRKKIQKVISDIRIKILITLKIKTQPCRYCEKLYAKIGIKSHEKFCYLNPQNKKIMSSLQ